MADDSTTIERVPTITFAKANRESKKGEDAACTLVPGNGAPACFAIFDGHSGKVFANKCSELVCQRLMQKGPPFTAEVIKDTMWAVDEEIGKEGVADGATAQVMCVEQVGDKLKCTMAWQGDSSAVVCDTSAPVGEVYYATESHTAGPDHQEGGAWKSEKGRIEFYRAVRKKIDHDSEKPHDTLTDDTSKEQIQKAVKLLSQEVLDSLGKAVDEEEVEILFRAFRRGKIIANTFPEGAKGRKKVYVRQRDKEHDANQVWVVATAETRDDPNYSDLQMTRSMGDWKAADMVLPNSQIHSFEVPADGTYRVCIASDGLWDVCNFSWSCRMMKQADTVDDCAKTLLAIAEQEYITVRGHDMMDDDTTVLVVELNPAGIKYVAPPKPKEGGCCAVS